MAPWTWCVALASSVAPAASVLLQTESGPGKAFRQGKEGCSYHPRHPQSSRAGVPCLPSPKKYPFTTNSAWRSDLGDRIVAAVIPRVTEQDCGGVNCFGDSTWCLKAMNAQGVIGLSYGIEERDMWSEKMAANWKVPTRLFDCFQDPKNSPALAQLARNGTPGGCGEDSGPYCYAAPYQAFRTCLGPKKEVIQGRKFDTLSAELAGRGPLSVHLKMDVEGSEWAVLEHLINNEEELAKIRTLDMEVHFGFRPISEPDDARQQPIQELLTRQTKILEQLRKKLTVVGSTLEVYHQCWHPDKDCPEQRCSEPQVHTPGGFDATQFAVSYVNPAIMPEP